MNKESIYDEIIELMEKSSNLPLEHKKHIDKVREIVRVFSLELDVTEEERRKLLFGAYIHDIGKIGINQQVLYKQGELTFEEREEVKTHSMVGYQMLRRYGVEDKDILEMVKSHHERIDGSGYPCQVKNIGYLTQVISICDVYEALRAERCYKKRFSKQEAIEILAKDISRGLFDKELGKKFLKFIQKEDERLVE